MNSAFVATAGVTGMGLFVQSSLAATAEIERNAKMAGVGVEAYQELTYAAAQNHITIDALTDGMKELSLRTDEFVKTGVGPSAEAFDRLGYTADELNVLLGDTPALLTDIISRMEGLKTAAQIRIADELFGGTGGEQFVAMIQKGAESFSDMRKEAHQLGGVLDRDLIQNAVEAKKEVSKLTTVLSGQFNSSIAILAPDITAIAASMTAWVGANRQLIQQ